MEVTELNVLSLVFKQNNFEDSCIFELVNIILELY